MFLKKIQKKTLFMFLTKKNAIIYVSEKILIIYRFLRKEKNSSKDPVLIIVS